MSRRSKLTLQTQDKICDYIRIGNTFEVSAIAAGICEKTFYNWCKRARVELERVAKSGRRRVRKREKPYIQFLQAIQLAEGDGEVMHVAKIADSGPEGSKWILTRRHPERWGNKQKLDADVNLSGKTEVEFNLSNIPLELLQSVAKGDDES